jgi:tRNA(Ile)-lysidine synthase
MASPPSPVAAARVALRRALAEVPTDSLVLVACSGGPDSLALAAATAFEAPRRPVRAGAVVVDHQLQQGSAAVAQQAAAQCRGLGLDPVQVVAVQCPRGPEGREAAARAARYAALDAEAQRRGAAVVLLGHTRDDQAEQVLLGLARGSGARSLSGMPAARGRYRRPFLPITREQTLQVCAAEGLRPWTDPHNAHPAYARARVRALMPVLEEVLGPGLSAALARTADQLREDADYLDALAGQAMARLGPGPWDVAELARFPRALRLRVWRRLLVAAGAPAGQVSARHTEACDALVAHWRGQGPVSAPGPTSVTRRGSQLFITGPAPVESPVE